MNQLSFLAEPLPAQRASRTSCDAALAMTPSRAEQDRRKLLAYARSAYGCTDEEFQIALCMSGNTQRPRRVELVLRGDLKDSGRTRKTGSGRDATVWEAA